MNVKGSIDYVLLDNMGPEKLSEAVKMRDAAGCPSQTTSTSHKSNDFFLVPRC